MELIINNLQIPLEKDGPDEYLQAVALKLKIDSGAISLGRILSKALDLRNQDQLFYKVSLTILTDSEGPNPWGFTEYVEPVETVQQGSGTLVRPIIVGFGPAGMFAALQCLERGSKPVIFERGKRIDERRADVHQFIKQRQLNSESNIQFGEGGAGSFSDGKLFSRRNNNSSHTNRVLKTFVKFGAPADIEFMAKPHLGTDVLCSIVEKMRIHILENGGEIHYNSKMTDLILSQGKAVGIEVNGGQEFYSSNIFLALGHSARGTLEMLQDKGVAMEQKPISIGVRIEHPAEAINLMRYGKKYQDYPGLGAATYSLNYTNRKAGRGAYTFCMCPGGEIVNASSSEGMLVINGMSYSRRSSPFSNAALIVSCQTHDYPSDHPLAGVEFQKEIERKAYVAGGGGWSAPAQNLMNFLGHQSSGGLGDNSFKMGLVSANLKDIYPSFITTHLLAAFEKWQTDVPSFVSEQALLVAAETRTSSPVRIIRNERYESVNVQNLHPIGEGSGYTGGITSSAVDAIKAVEIADLG